MFTNITVNPKNAHPVSNLGRDIEDIHRTAFVVEGQFALFVRWQSNLDIVLWNISVYNLFQIVVVSEGFMVSFGRDSFELLTDFNIFIEFIVGIEFEIIFQWLFYLIQVSLINGNDHFTISKLILSFNYSSQFDTKLKQHKSSHWSNHYFDRSSNSS